MESTLYRPSLKEGTRVLLVYDKHQQNHSTATVISVLPNPSRMPAHQWYDIRFDNSTFGRFLERHLQVIPTEPASKTSAA
jgi:hypothetical protein